MKSGVKIRATYGEGHRVVAVRSAFDACRSRGSEMPSCALIQHGEFMHHVIAWPIAVATAVLLVGCSDVVGPDFSGVGDSTQLVELTRQRKNPRPPPSDSVGIPPMPVPPIYEELPLIVE